MTGKDPHGNTVDVLSLAETSLLITNGIYWDLGRNLPALYGGAGPSDKGYYQVSINGIPRIFTPGEGYTNPTRWGSVGQNDGGAPWVDTAIVINMMTVPGTMAIAVPNLPPLSIYGFDFQDIQGVYPAPLNGLSQSGYYHPPLNTDPPPYIQISTLRSPSIDTFLKNLYLTQGAIPTTAITVQNTDGSFGECQCAVADAHVYLYPKNFCQSDLLLYYPSGSQFDIPDNPAPEANRWHGPISNDPTFNGTLDIYRLGTSSWVYYRTQTGSLSLANYFAYAATFYYSLKELGVGNPGPPGGGGTPPPPPPKKPDADAGMALARSAANVPHIFYVSNGSLICRSYADATYRNTDQNREVNLSAQAGNPARTDASGNPVAPACVTPSAWDGESSDAPASQSSATGSLQCVWVDGSTVLLGTSHDLSRSWNVITVPFASYTLATACRHAGRIIIAGYIDTSTADTQSGDWWLNVGVLNFDETYIWSNTARMIPAVNPGKSATLRVRDDGVIEFAYVDTSGAPNILQCSALASDASGDWG